jgi:hypothetical protein
MSAPGRRPRDSRDYARRVAERWARETMRRQLVIAVQYIVLNDLD